MKTHAYTINTEWTGNLGSGTSGYSKYSRNHLLSSKNKSKGIDASSDPSFRGDKSRYNPEELLVASLSSCHMLWYLHLCSENTIIVLDYKDEAEGKMAELPDGSGHFTEVVLRPTITISKASDEKVARALHGEAHRLCFIANSCNFEVRHEPKIVIKN